MKPQPSPLLIVDVRERRRRLAVCSRYPVGSTFVPEHCAPIATKKGHGVVAIERRALVAAMSERRNTPVPLKSPVDWSVATSHDEHVSDFEAMRMLLRHVQQYPAFFMFAIDHFRKLRSLYPNPDDRYRQMCNDWNAIAPRDTLGTMGMFMNDPNARAAVMKMALSQSLLKK